MSHTKQRAELTLNDKLSRLNFVQACRLLGNQGASLIRQGLGKTIQGIGVSELLAHEANISRVLIICPTSLKSQWRNEIHRFSNRDCQLVLGKADERSVQHHGNAFFTICNYEQVLRDILAIERAPWDLIVLDEAVLDTLATALAGLLARGNGFAGTKPNNSTHLNPAG